MVSECKQKEKAKREDIDDKEREQLYEPVEKLVETVFGSWVCLNHSFANVSV
jgi:E3 ubiquitin-protein ligase HECTD2